MNHFNCDEYTVLLADWVNFSQKHLYTCPERQDLICYGTGEHNTWGIQTHLRSCAAFAVASQENIDWGKYGLSGEQILLQALSMYRYAFETHMSGDFICTDGEKWGHSWISALGIERVMHALEAIDAHLNANDRFLLKTVIISECDWLLNEYKITSGLIKDNHPESNIWNGSLLYRGAMMYPQTDNSEAYRQKAAVFFANGISVEADEFDETEYDKRRVCDLFTGANFFNSMACNHHEYLNVGYMVVCLSNIAMLHFSMKAAGQKPDSIVYRHAGKLWNLVRSLLYKDGRLLRIGGDSRARYCYCQDYALSVWALIEDVFGEDCSGFENGWLNILKTETAACGDGSFLSARIGHIEERSPLYYTRLESDRACSISMILHWHSKYRLKADKSFNPLDAWHDRYHGAAFVHTGRRIASFVWHSCEKPQALCLPDDDSSLAEWRYNLCGHIEGAGQKNFEDVIEHTERYFPGGFLTFGRTAAYSDKFIAEGQQCEKLAVKKIAFAALPDSTTVLSIQTAVAERRAYIISVRGILWNIPNDIFNNNKRLISHEFGSTILQGGGNPDENETVEAGHRVNVDDKLGLASLEPLMIIRAGKRQVDIKGNLDTGTLYAEEVCAAYNAGPRWFFPGEEVYHCAYAMAPGDASQTETLCRSLFRPSTPAGVDAVGAVGADGLTYIMYFNRTDKPVEFAAEYPICDITTERLVKVVILSANEAALFKRDR